MSNTAASGEDIASRLARRVHRRRRKGFYEAFVLCSAESAGIWHRMGEVVLLVPGLAKHLVLYADGEPMIIDESCLCNGPWAGTAGSTGEARLDELELLAEHIRATDGVVLGVTRGDLVPDVNMDRVRSLYDIRIDTNIEAPRDSEARAVQMIHKVLDSSSEAADA